MTDRERRRQFEGWVSSYTRLIFHVHRSLGLEAEQAKEATQETFFQAWRSIDNYEGRASEKAWLTGIASNVGRKFLRSQQRGALFRVAFQTEQRHKIQSTHAPTEELLNHKQRREQLRHMIAQLNDRKRSVFALFYLEDMTVAEIADALELPPGTVRSTLQRARQEITTLWNQSKDSQ